MTKIETFDRATSKKLADDLLREITDFCAERGISASFGGGTMDDNDLTIRIKFRTEAAKTDLFKSSDGRAWELMAKVSDINVEMLGKVVVSRTGERCRVLGWNTKAPKMPIMLERVSDGRRLKAPVAWLKGATIAA